MAIPYTTIQFKTSPTQVVTSNNSCSFYPYPNTKIEFITDKAVCARTGSSDGNIEFITDKAVCARTGSSDGKIELKTDKAQASLIGNNIKDSYIELIVETSSCDCNIGSTVKEITIGDNTTETIIVGNKNSIYALYLDFTIIKLTSSDTITGKIYITHDGINTDMDVEYIDELGGSQGINFDSSINGSDIELDIIASSVGENLKMIYYIRQTL